MDISALISQPIAKELEAFEKAFSRSLTSDSAKMQTVVDYIMQAHGKRIRPTVLLLSALLSGRVTATSIESAVLLELLHTASLLHDDVVDDTFRRRGLPSVNAVFDNKVAILAGDYILSVSLHKAISLGNISILTVYGQLGKYLSLGELNQLSNVKELLLSEESYLKVIREKTAMLFSACTEMGALSAGASKEEVESLRHFGEYIGMCFQIRDDIFDYSDNKDLGKPTGNDLREGKVTLPLIYALNQMTDGEKARALEILKARDFSEDNIRYLISLAIEKGGIEYAERKMKTYAGLAEDNLSIFPDCDAKEALLRLSRYVMDRKK